MKKLTLKIILFGMLIVIPISLFVMASNDRLFENYGPSIEQQIKKSFKDVLKKDNEIVVLGNSRMYRGVNPEKFEVSTFNFSHDNDTYNQMYYRLKYLEEKDKLPKYVVLGTDYFQFSILSDTRNYVYKQVLGSGYMKDYDSSYGDYLDSKMADFQNSLKLRFSSIRGEGKDNVAVLKEDGQLSIDGMAVKEERFKRDFTRKKIQVEYFKRILKFNKENAIKTILVMPPLRDIERWNYSEDQIKEFKRFIESNINEGDVFYNFGYDKRFSLEDFYDKTHLNISGGNKFSEILGKKIKGVIEQDGES